MQSNKERARLIKPIQEQIQNHLKNVSQDLPGYARVNSVLDKEVEQLWINSIVTKVFILFWKQI